MSFIEKVDLTMKSRGRTPTLYPIENGEPSYVPNARHSNRIRYKRKGARKLFKNTILSVHSLYFRKQIKGRGKGKEITNYFYYTDGKEVYRIEYEEFILHFWVRTDTAAHEILLKMCELIRNQTLVSDVISFYSL